MKITILAAGAWGTALGVVLSQNGHSITLWGHDADRLKEIQDARENSRHLPGVRLPETWIYEPDLPTACASAELVVSAVPSKALRDVTAKLGSFSGTVLSVTKGIEHETGLTMCGVLQQTMPLARTAVLSGPSFATEVARGMPAAVVAASNDTDVAKLVQKVLHRPTFRVYTSTDLTGVELGGALKNVVAIAAGVCDGLGFGDSSKAALITRAMSEVRRLGVRCGAMPETFAGLSGLGDLTLTCFSRHSRNRGFGEALGKGGALQASLAGMKSVVEGYPTSRSAYQLARKYNVVTPIVDEVYAMLYENKNLTAGVRDLLSRDSKAED